MGQRVQAPNGEIVEFPDGMTDAQISAAMGKHYEGRRLTNGVAAFNEGVARGLVGDIFDKPSAAFGAAVSSVFRPKLGDFKTQYNQQLQDEKQYIHELKTKHPNAYKAGDIGGLFVGGAGIGMALEKTGAKLFPKAMTKLASKPIVKNALLGGGIGAVQGAMQGGDGNRVNGAIGGAAVGSVLGGGLSALGKGANSLIKAKALAKNPNLQAVDKIVKSSGKTLPELQKEASRLNKAGVPNVTFVDVSQKVARKAGSLARLDKGGEARDLAARRGAAMIQEVPSASARLISRSTNIQRTNQQIEKQLMGAKNKLQSKLIKPIEGRLISNPKPDLLRQPILANSVNDTINGLKLKAALSGTPPEDAAALRAMSQYVEPQVAPAPMDAIEFNPMQSADFANMQAQQAMAANADKGITIPNMPTAIGFMKSLGGIHNTGGEISNALDKNIVGLINNNQIATRGSSAVTNGKGNGLDIMARELQSQGYLPQNKNVSSQDVIDLLRNREIDPELWKYGHNADYQAQVMQSRQMQNQYIPDPQEYALENYYNSPSVQAPQAPIDGAVGAENMSLGGWEALRQRIDAQKAAAFAKDGGRPLANDLNEAYKAIFNPIRNQFPDYNNALGVGDAAYSQVDALGRGGKDIFQAQNADVAESVGNMSSRELRGYRQGASNALRQRFIDDRNNYSLLNRIGGGQDFDQKLKTIFGDTAASQMSEGAVALGKRVDAARALNPNFGSQTAENQANDVANFAKSVASPNRVMNMANAAIDFAARRLQNMTPAQRKAFVDFASKPLDDEQLQVILSNYNDAISRGIKPPEQWKFILENNGVIGGAVGGYSNQQR